MGDIVFALFVIGAVIGFTVLWRVFKNEYFSDEGEK